ncbi:putative glycosyltransferase [bioreactor metagenome]|uniref:Putative glycosyltransferase n=1 Tax=bioreactor metagenome TaxID=1076179 RepID=A0A645C0C6_9ZZZZ
MDKTISIVIPVYNEEESLPILYERLKSVLGMLKYRFEIIFVDDGSKDGSMEIIRKFGLTDPLVSYISLSRNFGKEIAMAAGLDFAAGDAVIMMDADLQDPPELIGQMISYWENGYDDVYAKRISREGESFIKKASSYLFYRILKKMTRVEIHEDTGDFRLLSRRAVEAVKGIREHHRYTKGYFDWIGFEKKEILFHRDPRVAGKTKWNSVSLMNLAIEGFTSFSILPLRIATFLGGATLIGSVVYLIYVLAGLSLHFGTFDGYCAALFLIVVLNGFLLVCVGILGEYLGRIFNETKCRPLYYIKEQRTGKRT